jgi:hypothetical protein
MGRVRGRVCGRVLPPGQRVGPGQAGQRLAAGTGRGGCGQRSDRSPGPGATSRSRTLRRRLCAAGPDRH